MKPLVTKGDDGRWWVFYGFHRHPQIQGFLGEMAWERAIRFALFVAVNKK